MFETYNAIFQKRADSYHEAMLQFPDARREEFAAAVECLDLFPNAVLCDVPSGGGYLSSYVPEDIECVFSETSRFFAERCSRSSRYHVLLSAIERLSLADSSVDRLLSLAALHHVNDKMAVLREFARVLKGGGSAVVADVEIGTGTAGFLNEFVDRFNSMGHDGHFLDADFYEGVSAQGMTCVQTRKPALSWHFENPDAMAQFCLKLFGLDLATPADVLAGVRDFLGYSESERGVSMGWHLSYVVMQKSTVSIE